MNILHRFLRPAMLAGLLALAACAPYSLIPAEPTSVANFQVDVGSPWNKVNRLRIDSSAPVAYWTSDGPALDSILFIGGVKSGQPIVTINRSDDDKDKLLFRDTMTSAEIVELWEATVAKVFNTTLAEGKNVQPARFAGVDGFRFDFTYVPKDEVDRKGTGYGAVKDGRLYLIFFSGTKLYHFGLREAEAMHIMQTAKITG